MFSVPLLVNCMGVKRLRHPPGSWKNLTNVNFARTREENDRGNSVTRPQSDGTTDEQNTNRGDGLERFIDSWSTHSRVRPAPQQSWNSLMLAR